VPCRSFIYSTCLRVIRSASMDDINEEEFRTACDVYAHFLQIDTRTEPELLAVAEDALLNLPSG
jgi:hypothetical protein